MKKRLLVALICISFIFLALGCGQPDPEPENTDPAPEPEPVPIEEVSDREAGYPKPAVDSDDFTPAETDPLTGAAWEDLICVIETNRGLIKISFFHDAAPRHVENFTWLARDGFFDGLIWHRYVPDFVIQGGDPKGTGEGGPGYRIPAEFSDNKHLKGSVASARQGDDVNPERKSNGSQFYICLEDKPHLDEGGYTVWGKTIQGMDIVLDLRQGDLMKKITIRERQ
jgi:peptidyl-prolyl cis-trans isomerase B (cyclophilin B)